MPKRFTDTEKWKKPFLRNLKAPYKLLWFYILDECDHAGIWQVDFEVAKIKIGENINRELATKYLSDKIVILDKGEKWFIPSFIEFQYGVLQENNRAHTKVILLLTKYNLIDANLNIKPLTSPLQGTMEEEKDMEEEKEEVSKVNSKKIKPVYELVFDEQNEIFSNVFFEEWCKLCKTKKWAKKEKSAIEASFKKLKKYAEPFAIDLIQSAISGEYQGITFADTDERYKKWLSSSAANATPPLKEPDQRNYFSYNEYVTYCEIHGFTPQPQKI